MLDCLWGFITIYLVSFIFIGEFCYHDVISLEVKMLNYRPDNIWMDSTSPLLLLNFTENNNKVLSHLSTCAVITESLILMDNSIEPHKYSHLDGRDSKNVLITVLRYVIY